MTVFKIMGRMFGGVPADITLYDVPYLSPCEYAEIYGLYSSLKEVANDILYHTWYTAWERNERIMVLTSSPWGSLTYLYDGFDMCMEIGTSYISIKHVKHNYGPCFENTPTNIILLKRHLGNK